MFQKLHVLGMNDELWDRVYGLGSETWEGVNSVILRCLHIHFTTSKTSLIMFNGDIIDLWGSQG